VVKNKAKLVAKRCSQDKGIDFDKNFALVIELEVIRILLAFASHMGIKLF